MILGSVRLQQRRNLFNKETRAILAYLSAELAKGPRQRELQDAVTAALRAELTTDVRNIRKSIAKLQLQVNDFKRRQDSIGVARENGRRPLKRDYLHPEARSTVWEQDAIGKNRL